MVWKKSRKVEKYGFTENIDFVTITQKRVTVRGNETEYTDNLIKLKMDTKERATIRTVITKFNKTLRPKITTFLQENNI